MTTDGRLPIDAQLETVKWHILRADGQRSGLWARTAAVLGADTLVVAGAAVMLTLGGAAWPATRLAALAAMGCVLISAVWATNMLSGAGNWSRSMEGESPSPMLYSLLETIEAATTYEGFRAIALAQTDENQLQSATSEGTVKKTV